MQINAESKALLKQVMARLDGFLANPWTAEMEPYQIIPNVYYVGNKYVGCYLFQTEKGLVLIDCAMQETAVLTQSRSGLYSLPMDISTTAGRQGSFRSIRAVRFISRREICFS